MLQRYLCHDIVVGFPVHYHDSVNIDMMCVQSKTRVWHNVCNAGPDSISEYIFNSMSYSLSVAELS